MHTENNTAPQALYYNQPTSNKTKTEQNSTIWGRIIKIIKVVTPIVNIAALVASAIFWPATIPLLACLAVFDLALLTGYLAYRTIGSRKVEVSESGTKSPGETEAPTQNPATTAPHDHASINSKKNTQETPVCEQSEAQVTHQEPTRNKPSTISVYRHNSSYSVSQPLDLNAHAVSNTPPSPLTSLNSGSNAENLNNICHQTLHCDISDDGTKYGSSETTLNRDKYLSNKTQTDTSTKNPVKVNPSVANLSPTEETIIPAQKSLEELRKSRKALLREIHWQNYQSSPGSSINSNPTTPDTLQPHPDNCPDQHHEILTKFIPEELKPFIQCPDSAYVNYQRMKASAKRSTPIASDSDAEAETCVANSILYLKHFFTQTNQQALQDTPFELKLTNAFQLQRNYETTNQLANRRHARDPDIRDIVAGTTYDFTTEQLNQNDKFINNSNPSRFTNYEPFERELLHQMQSTPEGGALVSIAGARKKKSYFKPDGHSVTLTWRSVPTTGNNKTLIVHYYNSFEETSWHIVNDGSDKFESDLKTCLKTIGYYLGKHAMTCFAPSAEPVLYAGYFTRSSIRN